MHTRHIVVSAALAAAAAVGVACSSSAPRHSGATTAAPRAATGTTDPGPNSSSVTDPGPNPTSGGPQTASGTLTIVDTAAGPCVRLTPIGAPGSFALVLPASWSVQADGLSVDGRVAAHAGDELFVTGHATSGRGACGDTAFAADHLVSVVNTP